MVLLTSATAVTYADFQKMYMDQPTGGAGDIINILAQANDLSDIMHLPTNKDASTVYRRIEKLPVPKLRILNQSVSSDAAKYSSGEESTAQYEIFSEVDAAMIELADNAMQHRANEEEAFMQAYAQLIPRLLFYGSSANDGFDGLSIRFNSLSGKYKSQVIDAGGTGVNLTSIWFVTWSKNTVHMIYPKNMTMGVSSKDLGERTKDFPNGDKLRIMESQFRWCGGLAVKNPLYVVRITNIAPDIDPILLQKLMTTAGRRLKTAPKGVSNVQMNDATNYSVNVSNTVIYANLDMMSILDSLAQANAKYQISYGEDIFGQPVTKFRSLKVVPTEALLSTESRTV